ncbi:selenocysteinyl-tRNA-specific translation factor [Escherichia coli]|uniref:Selenocysteinyl-tRNA-specific translation factor n=1 Tax=Escherichia coli TaxID=562 RepID=A0A376KMY3_ECOLX|nr:selenocysteinyl-tRNA-specific translation factor [Escherichia coli]
MRYLFIWNAARLTLADFAWARQLNGEGMRELLQQPGYIQAGYSLLNAPVAARWQRKNSRHISDLS